MTTVSLGNSGMKQSPSGKKGQSEGGGHSKLHVSYISPGSLPNGISRSGGA